MGVKGHLIKVLTCVSLMIADVEHLSYVYFASVYLLWINDYLCLLPILDSFFLCVNL